MKPTKVILFFFIIFPIFGFSQGFYIKKYHVDMHVKKSGQVKITEKISVFFTEERRGIIRKIPTMYYISPQKDSITSNRAEPSNKYFLTIDNIQINRNYTTLDETGFTTLRIGDADIFLTGDQLYVISYTVDGTINTFEDFDEFNWNIIGDKWDVPIERISFNVRFEGGGHGIGKNDVKLFTGKFGERNEDASYAIGSSIRGKSTKKFEPNEAMTIALRFRKGYFRPFYQIQSVETKGRINDNSSVNFTDIITVNYRVHQNGFIYKIPKFRINNKGKIEEIVIKNTQVIDENRLRRNFKVTTDDDNYIIHIGNLPSATRGIKGIDVVYLQYRAWGLIYNETETYFFEHSFFKSNGLSFWQELNLVFPQKAKFHKSDIEYKYASPINFKYGDTLRFQRLSAKALDLKIKIPDSLIKTIIPAEYAKKATYFAVTNFNSEIKIDENKEVHVHNKLNLVLLNHFLSYRHSIDFSSQYDYSYTYYSNRKNYSLDKITVDRKAILNEYYSPLLYNLQVNDKLGYTEYASVFVWKEQECETTFPELDYQYSMYDIINKTDSGALISLPLFLDNEKVHNGKCKIIFPETVNKEDLKLYIENSNEKYAADFSVNGNVCTIDFSKLKDNYQEIKVDILFPEKMVSGYNLSKEIELLYNNNKILLIPIVAFIVLFALWWLIGKDYKHTLVVRYQPPKNVTPAEAGLLWDDKLHRRDMVSLIYYWASKGYLEVIEKSNKLTLKKLAHLPSDAKPFEKTIFNALFTSGTIGSLTKVSSLRTSFAKQFKKAFKQMKKYSRKQGFYSRIGNFLSKFLIILSFPVLIVASIIALAESNTLDIFVSLSATAVLMFFFGKIMIKKSLHAGKLYNKIKGFREFIVTAELDRLKKLAAENPKYFEDTIAYAIILGYGKIWSEKFASIITEPPTWYKGYDSDKGFVTYDFTKTLVKGMYQMEKSFNYKPPKPKRTYSSSSYSSSSSSSSWSSSWSSSSSSSSSWSGSSSFSSGSSGYSGGGYGGGGGSSW